MKIVIDIPEDDYENKTLIDYFGCYSKMLDATIYNGTVVNDDEWMKKADNIAKINASYGKRDALESVRAEIEQLHVYNTIYRGIHAVDREDVFYIIDKHLRGNSDADNERRVSGDSTGDGSNGSSNEP